jgi:hypothetical protein
MMEKMREDRTNFKNRRRDITTDPIDIEKIKNTIGTFTPFRRFIFLKRQIAKTDPRKEQNKILQPNINLRNNLVHKTFHEERFRPSWLLH